MMAQIQPKVCMPGPLAKLPLMYKRQPMALHIS